MNKSKYTNLSTSVDPDHVRVAQPPKPVRDDRSPSEAWAHYQRAIATRPGKQTNQFPELGLEKRPVVSTEQAAHYLNRRPQTLRGWASAQTFPDGLRPVRVHGRLGWPVDGIRRALGVVV